MRPLLRRVTDEQVALYLEEHEPSLQAAIISAVEVERGEPREPTRSHRIRLRWWAGWCSRRWRSARPSTAGAPSSARPSRRYAGTIAAIAVVTVAVFMLGPAYLRHALSALLIVSRSVEAAAPYRIEVTPGNATVPRGVDQTITAKLEGFDSDQASLMVRKSPDAPFERMSLAALGDGDRSATSTRACCSTWRDRSITSSKLPG